MGKDTPPYKYSRFSAKSSAQHIFDVYCVFREKIRFLYIDLLQKDWEKSFKYVQVRGLTRNTYHFFENFCSDVESCFWTLANIHQQKCRLNASRPSNKDEFFQILCHFLRDFSILSIKILPLFLSESSERIPWEKKHV